MQPWEGVVRFDGVETTGRDAAQMVAAGLVHVPEGRRIFPNMNVRENLELGSYRRARSNRARNLERVFGIFPRLKERSVSSPARSPAASSRCWRSGAD